MKKSEFRKYPVGSSAYVIAHAKWRASRGKRPSAALGRSGILRPLPPVRNPRQALLTAHFRRDPVWTLKGHDTFEGTDYPLPGRFLDEGAAMRAAQKHCREVERSQPSRQSGGQRFGGIQDRIYVVHPSGRAIHVQL